MSATYLDRRATGRYRDGRLGYLSTVHSEVASEYRDKYRPWLFAEPNFGGSEEKQSLLQVWFPGAHGDVGGGYPSDESGLSNETLEWMVTEAKRCGLVCAPVGAVVKQARRVKHDELHANFLWGIAGMSYRNFTKRMTAEIGEQVLHETAAQPMDDWAWNHRRWLPWILFPLVFVVFSSVYHLAPLREFIAMFFAATGLIPSPVGGGSFELILALLLYSVYLTCWFAVVTWLFTRSPGPRLSRIYSRLGKVAGSAIITLVGCVLFLFISRVVDGWMSTLLFRLAGCLASVSLIGTWALIVLLGVGALRVLVMAFVGMVPARR